MFVPKDKLSLEWQLLVNLVVSKSADHMPRKPLR